MNYNNRSNKNHKMTKKICLFTCCDVNIARRGMAHNPCVFTLGKAQYRAVFMAYMLDTEPPGQKIPSPSDHPTRERSLQSTSSSIRTNTGATSYVYL